MKRGELREINASSEPAGCPEPFYRSLGFAPNGEMDDNEMVLLLSL